MLMVAASMVAATSCTDRSDYNDSPLDPSLSANKTLWENISENSELSDFASLLKKAGLNKELSQPSFYTVWAPLNGTYDAATLMQEDSATLRSHFANNHIANYNHQVAGTVDERIKALNEKSYEMKGSGSYTIGGVQMSQVNLPCVNGILHTLNGEINYYPNVYEYIFQAQNADSLAQYFKHYEHTTLDVENSVLGPVVNGRQTYIDSVMVTNNDLFRQLGRAFLSTEDSSYTMMVPTDKAWKGMYNTIKPYFNYISTTAYQDVANATSASSFTTRNSNPINAAYYTDSITKRFIARMLLFNNNTRQNLWVENGGTKTDSIVTTAGYALTNPDEYLGETKEKITMSNGYARLVDSLNVRPWDIFAQELTTLRIGKVFTASTQYYTVNRPDTLGVHLKNGATSFRYLHAAPTSTYSKPSLVMMLPGALSHRYNIYVVLMPPLDDATGETPKPNQLSFSVSFCRANGQLQATQNLRQKVTNDPTKVDTVYAGSVTFPVCYYGLGNEVSPNLKITSPFNVFNKKDMATYTRDIRIAAVIMRPVEYDEYLGNKH